MKFPDEVPILGTRHTPDTDYRKAMTKKETSPRNFIGKPLKINPFEVPEVLDYKNRAILYKRKTPRGSDKNALTFYLKHQGVFRKDLHLLEKLIQVLKNLLQVFQRTKGTFYTERNTI